MTVGLNSNQNGSNNKINGTSEMRDLINSLDWPKTPIGAMNTWPQSLKATIKTLLGSRYPMVLLWGEELVQIYNDAYTGLIGDKHPYALGRSIKQTQAESWEIIGPMIHEVMSTGVSNWVPAQMLAVNRSGFTEETYFSLSYSAVENDQGIIQGMLCVCSEVTQQVLGERQLRLQRDLAAKASETRNVETVFRDVAIAIDEYKRDIPFALFYLWEETNHSLVLQSTVTIDENCSACIKHFDIKDGEYDPWMLKKAFFGETIITKEVDKILGLPGGPWNELVQTALTLQIPSSAQKEPLGVVVLGVSPNRGLDESYISFLELLAGQVSVSLRNALAYEEERKRAEALAEIDKAKTAFFSNVSHEFRTPLTLMLGPLEETIAKSNKSLSDKDRDQLTTVYQNSLRLLKLVNTLLDFSRIEAKRLQASFEPTDLSTFTAELASAFESAINKVGLQYAVVCPPLSEFVFIDTEMWEKIVLNLISNALKFTNEGKITVALKETETHAQFLVIDTGVGIPNEEIKNLFKRFHRIENTRSRSHEGTGIGLALVKELVELHKGKIEVNSIPDKGTTFTVSIPKGVMHLDKEKIILPKSKSSSSLLRTEAFVNEAVLWGEIDSEIKNNGDNEKAEPTGQANKDIRILLVDDNADMLKYLKQILSDFWSVEAVKDGVEALAAARREKPHLVLSDVMMPNMNGFELLSEIRKDKKLKNLPVILLSARAREEATLEGLEKGANDYLVKPFSARELVARVKTQIDIKKIRKDNFKLKEAEDELKKFKVMSDYAFDAFILMREDGTFAYLNDLALKRWGYTKEEVKTIRMPDVDPLYQEENFKEVFALAQKQGAIPTFETIHKRKDGTIFPVEVSMGGITLDGTPHLFAVARDITERKQSEETLKIRNEQLQKINNDLDNFIYTASHDLKAPISNIEGLITTLPEMVSEESTNNEDFQQVMELINSSINRFKNTIQDLTDISRVQRNISEEETDVDVCEMLEEIKNSLGKEIRDTNTTIYADLENCPIIPYAKRNFRSVLFNLLSNSIKYRSPERKPIITVKTTIEAKTIVLSVQDNGLGMPPDKAHHAFGMFKRLHDHVEGTGVGLYIVKRIVENNGGKVEVESEINKGTTFKLYLKR